MIPLSVIDNVHLAALVSDDAHLQKSAADQGCPTLIVELYLQVDKAQEKGDFSFDVVARSKEVKPRLPDYIVRLLMLSTTQATLLALAALCFQHEPTRAYIAETNPPFLPHLLKALSHSSYGVRAAACQLTRALSRTVAILRTSLVDSGVAGEVIATLRRQVAASASSSTVKSDGVIKSEGMDEELMGGREYTVEVAATATLCNLIADFSPLKAVGSFSSDPWHGLIDYRLWFKMVAWKYYAR